ncbi:MAG TPA: zinc ribbon domain-containing protein [Chthonomonadaceae bacterium]|nr:zinc ribbon domain-containing protein [Chthonomonadaceae bacterium]
MKPCPNCQQPVAWTATFCPNCGYVLMPAPQERLLTSIPWVDVMLGILAALASPWFMGVGLIVAIVLYFVYRSTYTYFARGLLIGLIVLGVLILGGLALCIGIIATSAHK